MSFHTQPYNRLILSEYFSGDSRPGLAPKKAQLQYEKEKAQKEANKKNKVIPKHKLEATQREAGLKSSISSDSKGYALLEKMGYRPGMGIGKQGWYPVAYISLLKYALQSL